MSVYPSPYEESYPPSIYVTPPPPPNPATGVVAGIPGSFTPAGCDVPANITELRALNLLTSGVDAAWTTGQWVVIGTGNTYWSGTDWLMGKAP